MKLEIIFEISAVELVAIGNDDKVRMDPLLRYDDSQGWKLEGNTPGVIALSVVFERERADKGPNETDIKA